jgi:hypothetical protein
MVCVLDTKFLFDKTLIQIWKGPGPPEENIINNMNIARSQFSNYLLFADTNFLNIKYYVPLKTFEHKVKTIHPNYCAMFECSYTILSDLYRFFILDMFPGACYLDCDCIFKSNWEPPEPSRTYLADNGEFADLFCIWGGVDRYFTKKVLVDYEKFMDLDEPFYRLLKNYDFRVPRQVLSHKGN